MKLPSSALADILYDQYRGGTMEGLITIIAVVAIWVLLQKVILPKLGIST
jgi:hypothetical protein